MKRKRLGKSDLVVSEIGLGCMSLSRDEKESIRIIHAALDAGVNFLDTADLYQQGRNEAWVGKALKGKRQEVILATKVGNRWEPGKEGWFWDPSKAYIKEAVKGSLRRLGTDYIDLYQLHGGTIDDPIDETIEAFEELKQEGVIRWYGISSIRPNVIREYVKRSDIVSVMMQYSVLDRRPEESLFDLLRGHGISAIVRGPLAQGLLSDRTLTGGPPTRPYLDYTPEEIVRVVQQLAAMADERRTISQLALRFALAPEVVATAVPGASSMEQLHDNIQAADVPELTPEELAQIRAFSKVNIYTQHR
ncbi:MAG: aldo/keto reductase [Hydrogenibacillus sp.]|nr:aldo/keto reductase [Hydrogenibacillus sp.]